MPRQFAAPPDVLRWEIRSQGHGDCSIAALALALGASYENVLASAIHFAPTVLQEGMTLKEMCQVAEELGYKAKLKRKYTLDEETTGILSVVQPHVKGSDHVVYLWAGRVLEPEHTRAQLWLDYQDFLSHYQYEHDALIVLKQKEVK